MRDARDFGHQLRLFDPIEINQIAISARRGTSSSQGKFASLMTSAREWQSAEARGIAVKLRVERPGWGACRGFPMRNQRAGDT
jgi:hypothetical protein